MKERTKQDLFNEKIGKKMSDADWLRSMGVPESCRLNIPMLDRHGWRVMAPHLRELANIMEANSKNTEEIHDTLAVMNVRFAIDRINKLLKMSTVGNKVSLGPNKMVDEDGNIVSISGVRR
jgi:hypothetical protein